MEFYGGSIFESLLLGSHAATKSYYAQAENRFSLVCKMTLFFFSCLSNSDKMPKGLNYANHCLPVMILGCYRRNLTCQLHQISFKSLYAFGKLLFTFINLLLCIYCYYVFMSSRQFKCRHPTSQQTQVRNTEIYNTELCSDLVSYYS